MSQQMHLCSFRLHSPINHTVGSWALPDDRRLDGVRLPEYWKRRGETLERACFDASVEAFVDQVVPFATGPWNGAQDLCAYDASRQHGGLR